MEVRTGDLARALASMLTKEELKHFMTVPEELEEEAEKALGGQDRTTVDLTSESLLAKWAKKKREAQDVRNAKKAATKCKKRRNKMVKASKRQNRR